MEMKYVRTFVLCRNAGGEAEIFKTEVFLPRTAYDEGEHYEMAAVRAKEQGFEPLQAFDEHEPAGHALLGNYLAQEYVEEVAALKIWGFDQDSGDAYTECDPPSEGHLDSHCCLMELIEQARDCAKSFPLTVAGLARSACHVPESGKPPMAVVWIEGGIVQWVASDIPMRYLVLDADTDGGTDSMEVTMENGDTAVVARVPYNSLSECLPDWVARVVEEVESKP